jgi:hypothetical protein
MPDSRIKVIVSEEEALLYCNIVVFIVTPFLKLRFHAKLG